MGGVLLDRQLKYWPLLNDSDRSLSDVRKSLEEAFPTEQAVILEVLRAVLFANQVIDRLAGLFISF